MEDQRECYIMALVTANSKTFYVSFIFKLEIDSPFYRIILISIWFFILCASTKLIFSNSNEQTVMLKTGSVLSRYFPTKHNVNIEK